MLDHASTEPPHSDDDVATSNVDLDTIFARIDKATYELLEALGKSGKFHASSNDGKAMDLEYILLGLPKGRNSTGGAVKRINHFPAFSDLETERLAAKSAIQSKLRDANREKATKQIDDEIRAGRRASGNELFEAWGGDVGGEVKVHQLRSNWREKLIERRIDELILGIPFEVKAEVERGRKVKTTEGDYRLNIIDDGIGQFLRSESMPDDVVTYSVLHEISMYRALATLAEKYLPADNPSARVLRAAIDQLTEMGGAHVGRIQPELADNWKPTLQAYEDIYTALFERARAPEKKVAGSVPAQTIIPGEELKR